MFNFLSFLLKSSIIGLIMVYQLILSPDHGFFRIFWPNGYCKYYPTCSEYAIQSIDRFGIIKGILLATKRILKCNPWSKAGIDLVPGK